MIKLTNTATALEALKEVAIKVSQTQKGDCIHQTQRNKILAQLRDALFADVSTAFPPSANAQDIVAYYTDDGIILEIPNESVCDSLTSVDGSGAISVEIGFTIKSLEYNAKDEAEAHAVKVAEKEAKAKADAEKKAKKMAKDKANREAKAAAKKGE